MRQDIYMSQSQRIKRQKLNLRAFITRLDACKPIQFSFPKDITNENFIFHLNREHLHVRKF